MFAELFKESKAAARCITYLIFLIVMTAMFLMPYREDVNHDLSQARAGILFEETRWGGTQNNPLVRPVPGAADYGSVDGEVPEQVMRNVTYRLFRDISNDRYETYLFGMFTYQKSLPAEKQQEMFKIFEKITGKSFYDVDSEFSKMDLDKVRSSREMTEMQAKEYLKDDYYKELRYEFTPGHSITLLYNYEEYIPIKEGLSYGEFKNLIAEAKRIIGRKTVAFEDLSAYGSVPLTYEIAASRYETLVNKDKISGAYARLFSDYMGIVLGIGPALIAVEIVLRDKRRKKKTAQNPLLQEPDDHRIWFRFLSVSAITFLPVILFAVIATVELSIGVSPMGLTIDYFAFLAYSFVWLLPTVLISAALGLFMTMLTGRAVGIFVPFVLWYWSALYWGRDGVADIQYGAGMFLRHHTVGGYETYLASISEIMLNRTAYTVLAIALIAVLSLLQRRPDGKSSGNQDSNFLKNFYYFK